MLRAADLSFSYGGRSVLSGVDVEVASGEIVGVLGPNGSGKTTLLRLLAGLLTPESGRVTLDNVPLDAVGRRALARRLAVVPQELHLAFDYTVLEIVMMGRYAHLGPLELEGRGDEAAVRRALELTGTVDLAPRRFNALSGGERQRVVIACALAQLDDTSSGPVRSPSGSQRLLLLDEPTTALDLRYQWELGELVARLNDSTGLTVVISTHDLGFAMLRCHRLLLLADGRIVAQGPPAEVLEPSRLEALYGIQVAVDRVGANGPLAVVPLASAERRR